MKLCVSATGKDLTTKVDAIFGRARYLLIVDTETLEIEALDNSAAAVIPGAGIAAAQLIVKKGVESLLTGQAGANVFSVLENAGITIYEGASMDDTVQEAVDKFKQGQLKKSTDSESETICGPGMGRGGGRCRGRGIGQGMGPGQGRGRRN